MKRICDSVKLAAIKEYLKGNQTCSEIARSIGMNPSDLLLLIKRYQLHGSKAFRKGYTQHSKQFKLDVLSYMDEHGTSIRETTAIFNLSSATLIRIWKKQFELGGFDALESKKKGHLMMKKQNQPSNNTQSTDESIKALQAELEYLRMENAYLKKLNALVQEKEKSQPKKK
jgi:transposase